MTTNAWTMRRMALVSGLIAAGAASAWFSRGSRRSPKNAGRDLPTASLSDTMAVVTQVVGPVFAKGVLIRRRPVVAMAERTSLELRAVRVLQRLLHEYGSGPLMLRLPAPQAVILSPQHVHRVLAETPEPFATETREKRAALSHFEPQNVLISRGGDRADRRRFNEEVLELPCPVHSLSDSFAAVVQEEIADLLAASEAKQDFGWKQFSRVWFRIVRRVILGDGARDDRELTALLWRLRADANWAFLRPRRHRLRKRFYARLRAHLARCEAGSLAALIARTPTTARTMPEDQVAHWLFASDPVGMTTYRALALLAAHPDQLQRAQQDIRSAAEGSKYLPLLRATLLEALRLWPTTPTILRQTTQNTEWETGTMPAGTTILIFAPFFHRDDQRLPYAHSFAPDIWLERPAAGGWPIIPFSAGPGVCPGSNLVLLLGSLVMAEVLRTRKLKLSEPTRLNPGNLPATFDHYTMRFSA